MGEGEGGREVEKGEKWGKNRVKWVDIDSKRLNGSENTVHTRRAQTNQWREIKEENKKKKSHFNGS